MKIDRDLYRSFKRQMENDDVIKELVKEQNFEKAEKYLKEEILDRPKEFFTLEKLRESLGVDRKLTVSELLLYLFGHLKNIPSQRECLDEEFDKLDKELSPEDSIYSSAKEVFEAYVTDKDFREIIDGKKFAELSVHSNGEAFRSLPMELKNSIPLYVKQNVDLERLQNVR